MGLGVGVGSMVGEGAAVGSMVGEGVAVGSMVGDGLGVGSSEPQAQWRRKKEHHQDKPQ